MVQNERTTIYVNPNILLKFRIKCLNAGISMSKRLEQFMKKDIEK